MLRVVFMRTSECTWEESLDSSKKVREGWPGEIGDGPRGRGWSRWGGVGVDGVGLAQRGRDWSKWARLAQRGERRGWAEVGFEGPG